MTVNWKTYTIEELSTKVTDGSHYSPESFINGFPMFSVKDMRESSFDYSNAKTISESDYESLIKSDCQPEVGDILIAKDGSVLKHIFVVKYKPDYVLLSSIAIIRPNKDVVFPDYLAYAIKNPVSKENILNNFVGGSGVPRIILKDFKQIKISLPPLATQKAIAEVLSSLDDKIDLLHRQNKTLEQMAETLFRQWFVEEAKEDWEDVSLGNYIKTFNGVSYKSSELNPSDTAMLTLKNFARDGSLRLDGFKEYTGKYKNQHIVREGDLVVAHTDITQDAALIGNPVLVIDLKVYKTLIISMDLVKVESMFEYLSNEFLYYLMRTRLFKEHCIGCANGSTVLHLSKDAVPSFEFNMPPKDLIISFTSIVQPMMQKLNQNINQIRILEILRNTLLPKLMSGDLKIDLN
ncbi:MAG: restriction endonuclease subunit S [Bacteroidales bacterium]|nr:restriction endonuclease subunit S [Bacteroidales bacterium]